MGNKLKDDFWTVEKVAEAFRKGSCKIEGCGEEIKDKMTSLYIRDKIKEILREIDCPESVFRRRAKKQDGHFIFKGDDSVPDKIYRIIEFYDLHHDKICALFMSDEENVLMEMLLGIRPNLRQKPCNNTYMEHRRALKKFYANKYSKIYEQTFFIKVNVEDRKPSKCVRFNIYYYQWVLVKEWYEKWSFIMKVAMVLRINERILNGYRCGLRTSLPNEEDRKRFYLEGRWFDELEDYLKKDRMDEEEIYNASCNLYYYQSNEVLKNIGNKKKELLTYKVCCSKCVSYVKEILSHPLMGTSIDDFLYMQRKAKEELEKVYIELQEELEIEKEYDEIICGLKKIKKMVDENGLEGKKYKRLEKILDESMKRINLRDMSDKIDDICQKIRRIVKEESNCSIAKKRVIDFCSREIKKYDVQMRIEKNQGLNYGVYKRYFSEELKKIKYDDLKSMEGEQKEDYLKLIEDYRDSFIKARMKYLELGKKELLITDFLPVEEREEYWSFREYYTDRKLY